MYVNMLNILIKYFKLRKRKGSTAKYQTSTIASKKIYRYIYLNTNENTPILSL